MNVSAVIYFNGSSRGFDEGEGENTSPQEKGLRELVMEGAGYFLESYSGFLLFLSKVEVAELAGLDYNEAQMDLNNAIEKMESARDVFVLLKEKSEATPYDPIVIGELLNFNYDHFQKKNDLIEPIFDQVKSYLEKGRIREMYGEALSNTVEILDIAYMIKEKIDLEEFPEISTLWDLDESCSRSLRFGQYAARVFVEISQSK
jgi:hypothetical protein